MTTHTILGNYAPHWTCAHGGRAIRVKVDLAGHTASPILYSRTLDKAPTPSLGNILSPFKSLEQIDIFS